MSSRDPTASLMLAAKAGDVASMRRAIADGADINQQDDTGRTALMWAARFHHLDAVKALVSLGADSAVRDGLNYDAWGISARNYLENEPSASAVQNFITSSRSYQRHRALLTARADVLAKRIAKDFAGRKQRESSAYANTEFCVSASYRGMRCLFHVFAGGFDLWVQNFHANSIAISLNLEGTDNATYPCKIRFEGVERGV